MKVETDKNNESIKAILDDFQERAGKLHEAFAPTWNARADALKTIVSLSSASIVLSVTFSSSLRQLNAGPTWRYLIISSFALLTVALVSGFLGLWWGARVYRLPARTVDKRLALNHALVNSPSRAAYQNAVSQILGDALYPIYKADMLVSTFYTISGFCFCVAILILAVIGIARLF